MAKGLLAGAALAAAAPLAKRAVDAARSGQLDGMASKLGTGEALKDVRSRLDGGGARRDDEGDEPERDEQPEARDAPDDADQDQEQGEDQDQDEDDDPSGGPQATGKGRRMPIQQSVDVGVPVETAYNQFTQFDDWAEFMHRITRVSADDECTVSFAAKIWTRNREFKAEILTQIPDEKIKWRVSQGITHTGIVTFHELAPRLTRIELTMDVAPGGMIEKMARGMRFIKRAARADLHRYKAFIEMQERETGAWRGVIIDGELVEEHDPSYDEEREYSDVEDLQELAPDDDEDTDEDEQDEDEQDEPQASEEDEDDKPVRRQRRRQREKQPAPA
jgi:uncharacterized membrane protein